MEDNKGTDAGAGCSDWFLVEADCSDTSDLENDLEKLFNEETDSDISDLIDDGESISVLKLFHSLVRGWSPSPCRPNINLKNVCLWSRTAA